MSRADLFVVCKNPDCGAEVSPYVTECPYCGTRLQKRAPKLDKGLQPAHRSRRVPTPSLGRLRPGEIPGIRADSAPYVTGAIILATAVFWIATRAAWLQPGDLIASGPLASHWSRLASAPFTYFDPNPHDGSTLGSGVYQFATLFAVAVFGWLLERRHGGLSVAALFLLGAVGGTAVAVAVGTTTAVAGANGGALALLCAWAVPDLLERRRRREYGGDLLGTGVVALVLLLMPIARPEANPVAGGVGIVVGYLGGLVLAQRRAA
jgi:hypothetical protein